MDALLGKLLLIAGQAEVVEVLLDEGLSADGLLATVAGETILMPTVALMLHLFRAWWVEGAERERQKKSVKVGVKGRERYCRSSYTKLISLNLLH